MVGWVLYTSSDFPASIEDQISLPHEHEGTTLDIALMNVPLWRKDNTLN